MASAIYHSKRLSVFALVCVLWPSSSLAQNEELIWRHAPIDSQNLPQIGTGLVFVDIPEWSEPNVAHFYAPAIDRPWISRSAAEFAMMPDTRWDDVNRRLRRFTLAGLWLTTALGTVGIINRPSLLGDGRCQSGGPILGDYGCGPSTTLHGISAGTSMVLFTASDVIDLTTGPRRTYSQTRRVLIWVSRMGMAVLPLVGIISRFPDVIGIDDPESQAEFGRTVRTLHAGAGYVTVGAYTATFFVD